MTWPRNSCWFCGLALLIQPLLAQEDLFDSRRVIRLTIDISPAAVATLQSNADNHAYVRCALRAGDQFLADVGIHCRGDTARNLANGKPDFTITFDKFVRGQTFHAQQRLVLQSSSEDPSYLSAPIAFELFRQAGVPAPRCGFAHVELNGHDLGLYVSQEGVNRDFLLREFGNNDGNLYDEGDTHDVTGKLDKDHGHDGDDQLDVDALVAAARITDAGERWQQLERRLDLDRFLTFTAMEVLLGNQESYALAATKFRLYHNPASDRLVFFPKGVERVLEQTDGPAVPKCQGLVAKAGLTTPQGRVEYRKKMGTLLDTVFVAGKVQARVREIVAVIRPVVVGRDPQAATAFDAAVAQFQAAVTRRAWFVAEQLKLPDLASVAPEPQPIINSAQTDRRFSTP